MADNNPGFCLISPVALEQGRGPYDRAHHDDGSFTLSDMTEVWYVIGVPTVTLVGLW